MIASGSGAASNRSFCWKKLPLAWDLGRSVVTDEQRKFPLIARFSSSFFWKATRSASALKTTMAWPVDSSDCSSSSSNYSTTSLRFSSASASPSESPFLFSASSLSFMTPNCLSSWICLRPRDPKAMWSI